MREILSRGNHIATGAWEYGFYIHVPNMRGKDKHLIQTLEEGGYLGLIHSVVPATVGEYTGLTDKNGKKIFEGDIVEFDYDIGVVKMSDGCWGLDDDVTLLYDLQNVEVIGNIHDNPELLEGD